MELQDIDPIVVMQEGNNVICYDNFATRIGRTRRVRFDESKSESKRHTTRSLVTQASHNVPP